MRNCLNSTEEHARETQRFRRPPRDGAEGGCHANQFERCCGLDIHKSSIAACALITEKGKLQEETRRFGTMTGDLRELAGWLQQ
jgi:hypothetical protein